MTETMKALAEKMAEERYPLPERKDFMVDRQAIYLNRAAYLAGFEARDGMDDRIREEHKLMYAKLQQIQALIEVKGSYDLLEPIQSLITKIESTC